MAFPLKFHAARLRFGSVRSPVPFGGRQAQGNLNGRFPRALCLENSRAQRPGLPRPARAPRSRVVRLRNLYSGLQRPLAPLKPKYFVDT